jgi:hypothetical protein
MAETMRPRGGQASQFVAATPDTHPPAKISPMVVWLCSDAARNVNGRTFHVTGDLIARFADSQYERQMVHEGGWTLDALDELAPTELVDDLTNDFLLEDHPELKVFDL